MATQPVDRQRVYVAGLSAGGAMAAVLAQQHPEVFAAVGVHSGLVPGAAKNLMGALSAMKSGAKGWSAPASQAGARPVPIIVMHGDADRTVHQRNGEQLLQTAANGAATLVQTQEQGKSADGQRYTRTSLIDPAAPGKAVAEHWLLHGAGHAWSGGDARGSYASAHGVDASTEMLRFFLSHQGTGVATGA
jgi:poly(3-hydroxybutyrate) depolymerase